jgi:protein ImuB
MGYAAIYLPQFPVASWLHADPTVASQALAIIEGKAPLQRIISLNRDATKLGLSRGMTKVQAEAIGALLLRDRSNEEEQRVFEILCKVAQRFSPRIEVVTGPPNGYEGSNTLSISLLLDQTGTELMFGNGERYGHLLYAALKSAGFPCSVSVAQNAEASLILSQGSHSVTCVPQSETARRLAPLPVSLLRCDATMLQVFRRWGIRTLGDLAALPESSLISRIGQRATRLQDLARGVADHLLLVEEEDFRLEERVVLDNPVELMESLLFVLSPMLESIIRQAVERAYALRALTLTLRLDKADGHELRIRPALPTQDRELLLKLISLDLQAHPPQAAILEVCLAAEPTKPPTAQRGLFQPQFPEPDKLDLLTARLRSLAGDSNVGSPALRNSYRDDEFALMPFSPASSPTKTVAMPLSPRLALRRLRPPQIVRVTLCAGVPASIFWQGRNFKLAELKEPWQSSGYWWDQRHWAAQEWDAVTAAPLQALRLRHEVAVNAWSVAGVYD